MATNDIEIAPIGTRALLRDVATHLRSEEARHREQVETGTGVLADEEATTDQRVVAETLVRAATEEGDRYARLAGRVDALLAGWEE